MRKKTICPVRVASYTEPDQEKERGIGQVSWKQEQSREEQGGRGGKEKHTLPKMNRHEYIYVPTDGPTDLGLSGCRGAPAAAACGPCAGPAGAP